MKKWTTLLKLVLVLSVAVCAGIFATGLAQHILVILVMIALLKLVSGKEKYKGTAGMMAKYGTGSQKDSPSKIYKVI